MSLNLAAREGGISAVEQAAVIQQVAAGLDCAVELAGRARQRHHQRDHVAVAAFGVTTFGALVATGVDQEDHLGQVDSQHGQELLGELVAVCQQVVVLAREGDFDAGPLGDLVVGQPHLVELHAGTGEHIAQRADLGVGGSGHDDDRCEGHS